MRSPVEKVAFEQVYLRVLPFSPRQFIPPSPHIPLHIHVALTRKTKGRSLGKFRKTKLFFGNQRTLDRKMLPLYVPVTVHREQSVKRDKKPTRCNNQMFIISFCLNMFRASLCPSSGEQRPCYCIWCSALVLLDPTTQSPTTATNHIQQNQASTPNAVTRSLFS